MVKPFRGDFKVTQVFGVNPADYAKFGLKGHNGIDYATPTGTDILAPHAGKILEVGWDPSGYGTYIKVESAIEGSVLAHLKQSLVQVGDTVMEGALIGKSDNTGNSTGPHLHWGYYRIPRNRQNGYGGFIDQMPYLNPPTSPTPPSDSECQKNLKDMTAKYEEKVKLETFLRGEIEKKDKQIKDLTDRLSKIKSLSSL